MFQFERHKKHNNLQIPDIWSDYHLKLCTFRSIHLNGSIEASFIWSFPLRLYCSRSSTLPPYLALYLYRQPPYCLYIRSAPYLALFLGL